MAAHTSDPIAVIAAVTGMRARERKAFAALVRGHEAGWSASDIVRSLIARAYADRHTSREVRLAKCAPATARRLRAAR